MSYFNDSAGVKIVSKYGDSGGLCPASAKEMAYQLHNRV